MRREQQGDLVADYFARGGTIHRLPTPEPAEVSEILEWLEGCGSIVYRAAAKGAVHKYVYQGALVTLQKLVSIANKQRALRDLPPFQLVPPKVAGGRTPSASP